jgi:aerobic C4-dicarboxylate transport protein
MQNESKRAGGKPSKWYFDLTTQVLVAMCLGALAGWLFPQIGAVLKPFAELFIKMVKMVIGPLVFLMVVAGISGMGDLKKVGRVGVKAVIYFEVVTTVALVIGLVAGNLFHPGSHMSPPTPTESQRAVVEKFSGIAKEHSVLEFFLNIVPDNVFGAFVHADVLQIMFFAVLFGAAILAIGEKGRKIRDDRSAVGGALRRDRDSHPICADRGIQRHGLHRRCIRPLVLGLARAFGAEHLRRDGVLCLRGTRRRRQALWLPAAEVSLLHQGRDPHHAEHVELRERPAAAHGEDQKLGCAKSVVALVLPTGYTLNQDGTSIHNK